MNNKILVALFLLVLIIGLLYFTHEVYTRPSEEFVDMKKNINKQKPVPKKVNVVVFIPNSEHQLNSIPKAFQRSSLNSFMSSKELTLFDELFKKSSPLSFLDKEDDKHEQISKHHSYTKFGELIPKNNIQEKPKMLNKYNTFPLHSYHNVNNDDLIN